MANKGKRDAHTHVHSAVVSIGNFVQQQKTYKQFLWLLIYFRLFSFSSLNLIIFFLNYVFSYLSMDFCKFISIFFQFHAF